MYEMVDNGEIQFPSTFQIICLSANSILLLHHYGGSGFHTSVPSGFEVGEVMGMDLFISVAGL
jgi:hypothetical protein